MRLFGAISGRIPLLLSVHRLHNQHKGIEYLAARLIDLAVI